MRLKMWSVMNLTWYVCRTFWIDQGCAFEFVGWGLRWHVDTCWITVKTLGEHSTRVTNHCFLSLALLSARYLKNSSMMSANYLLGWPTKSNSAHENVLASRLRISLAEKQQKPRFGRLRTLARSVRCEVPTDSTHGFSNHRISRLHPPLHYSSRSKSFVWIWTQFHKICIRNCAFWII